MTTQQKSIHMYDDLCPMPFESKLNFVKDPTISNKIKFLSFYLLIVMNDRI